MAKIYRETIVAHPSIYSKNEQGKRGLQIEYALPEAGTNRETGILFLIPAYGGNLDSKVYQKMRRDFSDKYNLIVIQSDYFGIEYMKTMVERMEEFGERAEEKNGKNWILRGVTLEENLSLCNDMGLMQAIDVIQAGLYVIHKLSSIGMQMNFGKIIAYGSSHGSYLGYLINRLCPGVLTLVIDNSAYCIPNYLYEDRAMFYTPLGKSKEKYSFEKLTVYVKYLIQQRRQQFLPDDFYDLNTLYRGFDNRCMILSFHGTDDRMVSIEEKRGFIEKIGQASLIEISKDDVDGKYFKSSQHGLGVDLLNLYEAVESLSGNMFVYRDNLEIPAQIVLTGVGHRVIIDYEELTPHIIWEKKKG